MVKWVVFLPFKDKLSKFAPKPWGSKHFSSFVPVFPSGKPTPIKILYSNFARIDYYLTKLKVLKLKLVIENCRFRKHLKLDDFDNNW